MRHLILVIALSLLAVANSAVASAEPLSCTIFKKFHCDATSGCKRGPNARWNVVDPERQTFSRCEGNFGCEDRQAQMTRSGNFLNIEVPGDGLVAKLSDDGSQFIEIVTLGSAVHVSFGSCQ